MNFISVFFICCSLISFVGLAMDTPSIIKPASPEHHSLIRRFPTIQMIGESINASAHSKTRRLVLLNGKSFSIETSDEMRGKSLIGLEMSGDIKLSASIAPYYIQENLGDDHKGIFEFCCGYRRYSPHRFELSVPFMCKFSDGSVVISTIKIATNIEGNSMGPIAGHLIQLCQRAMPEDIILVSRDYYPRFTSSSKISALLGAILKGDIADGTSDRVGFDYEGREWFIEANSLYRLYELHKAGAIDSLDFEREEVEWLPNNAKVRCFYKLRFKDKNSAVDFDTFRITTFR